MNSNWFKIPSCNSNLFNVPSGRFQVVQNSKLQFQLVQCSKWPIPSGSQFQVGNSKWSKFQVVVPSGKNSKWNSNLAPPVRKHIGDHKNSHLPCSGVWKSGSNISGFKPRWSVGQLFLKFDVNQKCGTLVSELSFWLICELGRAGRHLATTCVLDFVHHQRTFVIP